MEVRRIRPIASETEAVQGIAPAEVALSASAIPIEAGTDELPPAILRLPPHLRDAAARSWVAREEDYRYRADR